MSKVRRMPGPAKVKDLALESWKACTPSKYMPTILHCSGENCVHRVLLNAVDWHPDWSAAAVFRIKDWIPGSRTVYARLIVFSKGLWYSSELCHWD